MKRASIPITEVKLAPGGDTETMTFSGYGAVFGNVDAYGDVIKAGAFAETLQESQKSGQWPAMLLQHGGWGMNAEDITPIGVWTELAEDGHGLKVQGKFADTERGREAYQLLKMEPRPAINGLSIGYIPQEWEKRVKPEDPKRTLKKVSLVEISLVTFPANREARVQSVKSIEEIVRVADVEDYLREAGGFSRAEAKHLVASTKAALQRDAGSDMSEIAELLSQSRRFTI